MKGSASVTICKRFYQNGVRDGDKAVLCKTVFVGNCCKEELDLEKKDIVRQSQLDFQ